ncbi:hypothetical protein GY45DRAFT_413142 [Cubamyces sp. BRFM 1775]|nr:hypothetical protein GY45DRAFT_413142 [Cubamyces sp. BRFM 1775]
MATATPPEGRRAWCTADTPLTHGFSAAPGEAPTPVYCIQAHQLPPPVQIPGCPFPSGESCPVTPVHSKNASKVEQGRRTANDVGASNREPKLGTLAHWLRSSEKPWPELAIGS